MMMKASIQQLLLLAAVTCPVMAIEPPVESQPLVPSEPAREAPAVRALPAAPPKAQVVAEPEAQDERPYIGVILEPVPEILSSHLKLADGEGVVVGELIPGGPADVAGLEAGDLITRINGAMVGSPEHLRTEVEKHGVGDEVELDTIHGGDAMKVKVQLEAAPERIFRLAGANDIAVDQLNGILDTLPKNHADLIRDAMKLNLQAFEDMKGQPEARVPPGMHRELLQRLERGLKGGAAGADGGAQMLKVFGAESTFRLLDNEGSIEMKTSDGSKEAKVFDKSGKLLWEGPYDTEQDKAAVPDDIRERIDRLNIDVNVNGEGLRLEMGRERFRKLDDIKPGKKAAEPKGEE